MHTIDVSGLPDAVARALAEQAEYWRRRAKKMPGALRELPRWPGIAPPPERLRRRYVYEDVG